MTYRSVTIVTFHHRPSEAEPKVGRSSTADHRPVCDHQPRQRTELFLRETALVPLPQRTIFNLNLSRGMRISGIKTVRSSSLRPTSCYKSTAAPLAKHSPVFRDMNLFPVRIVGATCNCNSIRLSDTIGGTTQTMSLSERLAAIEPMTCWPKCMYIHEYLHS